MAEMYLSPDVEVTEIDLSSYTRMMSKSTIIGLVGGARSGPIGEEVSISSMSHFREVFGDPIDASGVAAYYVLQNSSSLRYVRAASDTAAYRQASIDGKIDQDYESSALVIRSKYKGSLFDKEVKVTIEEYSGTILDEEGEEVQAEDMYTLSVVIGTTDEKFIDEIVSLDPKDPRFIERVANLYFDFILTEGVTSLDEETVTLSEGDDGVPGDSDIVTALDAVEDPEQSDIQVLVIPGNTKGSVVSKMLAIANARKDLVVLLDPPQNVTASEATEYFDGKLSSHEIGKVNTSYAAGYYPWVKIYDPAKDAVVWSPPTIAILEAMTRLHSQKPIWTAPAGVTNMDLAIVSEVELPLKKRDRDLLYSKHVNPICNYRGLGLTVLGQKTMQRKPSSVDRLNVRFLSNYIKRLTMHSTVGYLFLGIDETTMSSWVQEMDTALEQVRVAGGVYDYQITMDWTTVTQDHLNNNIMPGAIQIKPTKTAEFIPIDLVLKNKDDSFI